MTRLLAAIWRVLADLVYFVRNIGSFLEAMDEPYR